MDRSIIRVTKELSDLQRTPDLSIAVACADSNVRWIRALIVGPPQTPYQFGFFEFDLHFGPEYPSQAPVVKAITTNGGRTRFNPNIYATGKVCLSILGTWHGEAGEMWSSAQGMESILISIQSLMSANPYENEPGHEACKDKKVLSAYNSKVLHETLRISVIRRLEDYMGLDPPRTEENGASRTNQDSHYKTDVFAPLIGVGPPYRPFHDLCKRRFLWYFSSYIEAARKGSTEVKDGATFKLTKWESPTNGITGTYNFPALEKRLIRIKDAIDAETTQIWPRAGLDSMASGSGIAANLQHQYDGLFSSFWSRLPHELNLENKNPFVWLITYFGKPDSDFDGGALPIKINFSPRFPDEQPRVTFGSKVFHHCITEDGTACYTPDPRRREDVKSHIEAIFAMLEDTDPAYDPRKVGDLEACKLYWDGGEVGRKQYRRKLRRSVQDSLE